MPITYQSSTLASASAIEPIPSSERLHLLDILRGFAIFGMIIVHFADDVPGGGTVGARIRQIITLFVEDRAYATFAIMFGVGFAVQLQRSATLGDTITWRFLRRLLGVFSFGVLTFAIHGGSVLIGYAYTAPWLLLVRRWSTRALLIAVLVTVSLGSLWNAAVGSYQWITMGTERANAVYQSRRPISPGLQEARTELRAAEEGTNALRLAWARLRMVYWTRTDLRGDWQRGDGGLLLFSLTAHLPLFLIGLLAFRLGVFTQPAAHRRLLTAVVAAGALLWVVDEWQLSSMLWPATSTIPVARVARPVQSWLGLGSIRWALALTYIGTICLVVTFSKAWEQRLSTIFGAAGRLALTNFVLQGAAVSVMRDNYGLGVPRDGLTPQWCLVVAVLLFATLTIASRWWLVRFRLGPAEWLLRSLTYGRVQPLRRPIAQGALAEPVGITPGAA